MGGTGWSQRGPLPSREGNLRHLSTWTKVTSVTCDARLADGKKRDSADSVCTGSGPVLPRKEVIQPQVLLLLPCYDFTPLAEVTLGAYEKRLQVPPTRLV